MPASQARRKNKCGGSRCSAYALYIYLYSSYVHPPPPTLRLAFSFVTANAHPSPSSPSQTNAHHRINHHAESEWRLFRPSVDSRRAPRTQPIVSKAEWRKFLPNVDSHRVPTEARTLIGMLDQLRPVVRTDVYFKAGADVGVKRRVSKTHADAW